MSLILIIDDEAPLRLLFQEVFIQAGYETVAVAGGREGLQWFARAAVDLVILDLFMPEMDGIECIREIRRKHPRTKIVAISGGLPGGGVDLLHVAKLLGADRALAKPFPHTELLAAVREELGASAPRPVAYQGE